MQPILYTLAGIALCLFLVAAIIIAAICWMAHGEPDALRSPERDSLPDPQPITPDFEEEQIKTLSGVETHYAPSYESHPSH